jgi:hypothetical protein
MLYCGGDGFFASEMKNWILGVLLFRQTPNYFIGIKIIIHHINIMRTIFF